MELMKDLDKYECALLSSGFSVSLCVSRSSSVSELIVSKSESVSISLSIIIKSSSFVSGCGKLMSGSIVFTPFDSSMPESPDCKELLVDESFASSKAAVSFQVLSLS